MIKQPNRPLLIPSWPFFSHKIPYIAFWTVRFSVLDLCSCHMYFFFILFTRAGSFLLACHHTVNKFLFSLPRWQPAQRDIYIYMARHIHNIISSPSEWTFRVEVVPAACRICYLSTSSSIRGCLFTCSSIKLTLTPRAAATAGSQIGERSEEDTNNPQIVSFEFSRVRNSRKQNKKAQKCKVQLDPDRISFYGWFGFVLVRSQNAVWLCLTLSMFERVNFDDPSWVTS